MKVKTTLLFLFTAPLFLLSQPNCEIYKRETPCRDACESAMMAIRYKQGSFISQVYFDLAISTCPEFAYAYMEKGVPHLKRGNFIHWKQLIDKAVEHDPLQYLGYRGWCRLQFLRDYEGAIEDIEALAKLIPSDIGYCQTGDYHLDIARALSYKMLGQRDTAKAIFYQHINHPDYSPGLFDFYHLGVLEYELGDYDQAITHLYRQIEENDYLGETYYFLALAEEKKGNIAACKSYLQKAKTYYEAGKFRRDSYTETIDKIYLVEILEAIEKH